jgi:hypothetical protein
MICAPYKTRKVSENASSLPHARHFPTGNDHNSRIVILSFGEGSVPGPTPHIETRRPSVGLRRHVFCFDPTPSGWPTGGTLLSASGPCLSLASWSALLRVGDPPLQSGQTGRQWFWPLLPKQKWLVALGRNPAEKVSYSK